MLATTGPWLVNDVYRSFFGVPRDGRFCGAVLAAPGVRAAAAYPVGSWFTPCRPNDADCEL